MPDNPNPYLMNEEQVPTNWTALEVLRNPTGAASAAPVPHDMPQFFSGSVSPSLQHDTSFVGTEVGTPRIPKHALMPLGNQLDFFKNAAAQSTIIQAPAPVAPVSASGLTSVGLSMPGEFAVSNSPLTSNGTIAVAWNPEQLGQYLGVSQLTGVPAPDKVSGVAAAATTASSSITPTGQNVTLYFACCGTNVSGTVSAPTGGSWTLFDNRLTTAKGWSQNFGASAADPQTVSYTPSGGTAFSVANVIISFTATSSAVVTSLAGGASGSVPSGSTSTATVIAGTALVAYAMGNCFISSGNAQNNSMSITDSKGNTWYQLAYQRVVGSVSGAGISSFIGVWFCPNPQAGSTTFTLNMDSSTGGSGAWAVLSLTNLANSSSQIPAFRFINFSDITGICPVSKGGTGSNLAATGGPNQFLRQNAAGANIDVVQPDFSTLAGNAAQFPPQYNGQPVVSSVFPFQRALRDSTGQTANQAATNFIAAANMTAGMYRVSVYIVVQVAATTSSTLPDTQIIFTDRDSGAVITIAATPPDTTNTTTTFHQATFFLNVKNATAVQFAWGQVTPYASVGGTAMTFAYHARLEQL